MRAWKRGVGARHRTKGEVLALFRRFDDRATGGPDPSAGGEGGRGGWITAGAFKRAHAQLRVPAQDWELEAQMRRFGDAERPGKVNFKGFCDWLFAAERVCAAAGPRDGGGGGGSASAGAGAGAGAGGEARGRPAWVAAKPIKRTPRGTVRGDGGRDKENAGLPARRRRRASKPVAGGDRDAAGARVAAMAASQRKLRETLDGLPGFKGSAAGEDVEAPFETFDHRGWRKTLYGAEAAEARRAARGSRPPRVRLAVHETRAAKLYKEAVRERIAEGRKMPLTAATRTTLGR